MRAAPLKVSMSSPTLQLLHGSKKKCGPVPNGVLMQSLVRSSERTAVAGGHKFPTIVSELNGDVCETPQRSIHIPLNLPSPLRNKSWDDLRDARETRIDQKATARRNDYKVNLGSWYVRLQLAF